MCVPTSTSRVDVNSISSFCLDKFVRWLPLHRVYVCSILSSNATKYRAWARYYVCCKFQFDVKMELLSTRGWDKWGYCGNSIGGYKESTDTSELPRTRLTCADVHRWKVQALMRCVLSLCSRKAELSHGCLCEFRLLLRHTVTSYRLVLR